MPENFSTALQPLRDFLTKLLADLGIDVPADTVLIGAGAIVGLVIVLSVLRSLWLWLARKVSPAEKRTGVAELTLTTVDEFGPPSDGPQVVCYHVPVRLAAIVFAPLGRGSVLPALAGIENMVNEVVDRLGEAIEPHDTQVKLWPPQLSADGFASVFFGAIKLKGKKGKGTPWNALAGRCEIRGQTLMIGMAFRADGPNNLGQMILQHEYNWREVVQVRATAEQAR